MVSYRISIPDTARRPVTAVTMVAILCVGVMVISSYVAARAPDPIGAATSVAARTVSTKGFPSGPDEPGIFTDRCAYSHSAADDPILAPGKPGASMHHDFFGNAATSARSTASSLTGGHTTCTTSADASAYWTPVIYQHGQALKPSAALIYWRKPARMTGTVQTIPAGLQMIAGNEMATRPQPLAVIRWTCTGKQATETTAPHDCAGRSRIRLVVTFPSCWDGHTLDGAQQTNVVYPVRDACPRSHPVLIPQVVFHVSYPTSSAAGLTLSMTPTMQGSATTAHVDFINGWNQSILARDVVTCVASSTRCGPVTGEQAVPQGPRDPRHSRMIGKSSRDKRTSASADMGRRVSG